MQSFGFALLTNDTEGFSFEKANVAPEGFTLSLE